MFPFIYGDIENILEGSGDEDSDEDDQIQQDLYQESTQSSSSDSDSEYEAHLSDLRWKKAKFFSKEIPAETPSSTNQVKSPAEYFEEYFTYEIYEQFALATNQYYMIKNGEPLCTPGEIKIFFGIHGLLGCFTYPRMKLFWSQRYKLDPIANAMPRDRFFLLRGNIHVRDVHAVNEEEEQKKNKLWRIQPLIDAVRGRCLQLSRDVGNFSINEQMIPFHGRCPGLKIEVKNKPRPKGLKNYVVTTSQGKVLDFEIYQGQTTNLPDIEKFGLGPAVILRLASSLPDGSFLYFDENFTSIPLMQELVKRKKEGTGTLTVNKFNTKNTIKYYFKKDTSMKRGEHEEIVNADRNVCLLKWKDNKGVLLASTAFGSEPLTSISKWDRKTKNHITVPCPAVVKNYNSFMRGVDICEQMMENYRTWVKTKKWTLKVILHLYDLAIVNSWMEYREDCKAAGMKSKEILELLDFRLSISDYLLAGSPRPVAESNTTEFLEMPHSSKYRPSPLPLLNKQIDGFNHWPIIDTLKQPRSCRALNCTSRSRCRCAKCDVYLCLTKDKNCFIQFHQS